MDCSYEELEMRKKYTTSKAPFFKQFYVIFGTWLAYFMNGFAFGIPTVMIPQIRKAANSTDAVSPEMASWLYSTFSYSSLPWIVIICVCTRFFGRKIPFSIVCVNMFAYFNLLYFSTSVTQVLIAEIMQGVTHASHITMSAMIVTEYASPKNRGFFLTVKSANFYWGVWVANSIGTFFHWRYIPLCGIFLSLLFITVAFWPESPQWLASQGKFEECRVEHRWLRGTDIQSEKELEHLIQSQTAYIGTRNKVRYCNLRSAVRTIRRKAFYKPMFLAILLMLQNIVSGKLIFSMYAIEMIKKMTSSESTAYIGMLIIDAVTIGGLYTGCILCKVLNRRTLLFSGCSIAIAFLFIISLYIFLQDLGLLVGDKIVSLVLLSAFSVSISCGPLILTATIANELTPLRCKSSITMITALSFTAVTANLMKLFPFITKAFHMSGAFFLHGILSTMCCVTLYIFLPETKDKSLQEIEDLLMGRKAQTLETHRRSRQPINK